MINVTVLIRPKIYGGLILHTVVGVRTLVTFILLMDHMTENRANSITTAKMLKLKGPKERYPQDHHKCWHHSKYR
jgi:hypothetical protein